MITEFETREVAAGAVEEANAVVGACLCTGEPDGVTAEILGWIQDALSEVAASLLDVRPPADQIAEISSRVQEWASTRTDVPTGSRSLTGTHSLAAGLLRLAGTVVRRATRDARAVAGVDTATLDHLAMLPAVFHLLATDLDNAEIRSIPLGICLQP